MGSIERNYAFFRSVDSSCKEQKWLLETLTKEEDDNIEDDHENRDWTWRMMMEEKT